MWVMSTAEDVVTVPLPLQPPATLFMAVVFAEKNVCAYQDGGTGTDPTPELIAAPAETEPIQRVNHAEPFFGGANLPVQGIQAPENSRNDVLKTARRQRYP